MTPLNPKDDQRIDEELLESFPASDPPSHAPATGAQIASGVVDNPGRNRFELPVEGQVAFLDYERRAGEILLVHAEVPPALRHSGIGGRLVDGAVKLAEAEGLRIVPICPFVRTAMQARGLS